MRLREARLEQMSIAQQVRLTHETPNQREARLEEMSIAQLVRLTHDTPDQREARLEQVSLIQQMRLSLTDPCDSGSEGGPSPANEPCTTEETDP